MAKIYVDTNIFIDFYQSAQDAVSAFDELSKFAAHLVFTEQSIREFQRNRNGSLANLIQQFEKSIKVAPYTTSLLQHMPEFKALIEARDTFAQKANEVTRRLRELQRTPGSDPVSAKFLALSGHNSALTLTVTPELVNRAHQRKLLGNPPTSPDKYTVGDEVTWESLLEHLKDDLIVVSRDRTFSDNFVLLAREFQERTGKQLILVTGRVADALRRIGETPSKELVEEEERSMPEELMLRVGPQWSVVEIQGTMATVSNGQYSGRTPLGPNPDSSFRCPFCSSYGPWNGARCMNCGRFSDPDD